jgi:hypothetical protein
MAQPLLDVGQLEVVETRVDAAAPAWRGSWPCPGCGERRDVDSSMHARVRNAVGLALERWVLLCLACADRLLAGPSADQTDGAERSTTEPWLESLADNTGVMRALERIGEQDHPVLD